MGSSPSKQDYLESRLANPSDVFNLFSDDWYGTSLDYWQAQEPTVEGMLGGVPEYDQYDIETSKTVIENFFPVKRGKCADVASGIGRVSEKLLRFHFDCIDLVEPVEKFLNEAKNRLNGLVEFRTILKSAQEWEIECLYDCFWLQWVLFFLKDDDAISFLKKCKEHLTENGRIIIKDNISTMDKSEPISNSQWFPVDRSIARVYSHFWEICYAAGLEIEYEKMVDYCEYEDLMPLIILVLKRPE